MTPLQTCLVALAFVAAAPPAGAQQQRVYQWKDAQGVTHYTDTPPAQAHKRRDIDVRTGTSIEAAPAKADESEQCTNARSNLQRLQGADAVGMDTNGDGKADRNMSAEERKAQLDLNQAAVKAYCPPASK